MTRQNRVATSRGELPTDAYATVNLRAGVRLPAGVELSGGVLNLLDEDYVHHLNSKNPFTGQPIPEPGRVIFGTLSVAF